jgi:ATP-dependent helicase HepA
MTILERDRAAAYFADAESGTRVLICSEIGSEGRNFQFAHNLILFDLPFNPDLLEQRIGRLDRIGQRHTIHLHVPYLVNTAQEIMFHWYEDGLGAFTSPCRTGQALFDQVEADLVRALKQTKDDARELIARTQTLNEQLLERLEKGRDRLLEYNSCRPGTAAVLHAQAMEADRTSRLPGYMGKIFDCFGVHSEDHPGDSLILSPAEDMVTAFPHLPDEGLTVTFSRKTALIHENWQYLTWCHPMVTGAMDMVSGTENGNATLTSFKYPDFTPGSIFIECYYIIESPLHREPVLRKLVAPQLIRLLIDETGTSHERELSHDVIESTRNSVSKQVAMKIISMKQSSLKKMIEQCNQSAIQLTPQIVDDARKAIDARLKPEITRLQDLKKINPAIRREEIDFFVLHLDRAHRLLDSALPRLDAVRVLVAA